MLTQGSCIATLPIIYKRYRKKQKMFFRRLRAHVIKTYLYREVKRIKTNKICCDCFFLFLFLIYCDSGEAREKCGLESVLL